jgi:CubicO group peptidase (beta-lactamase class C family)
MRLKTFIKQGRYISLVASLVLAGFVLAIYPANAAPVNNADFQQLDAVITAQMQKHDLPGVSVAVIDGDQIVYLQGYGTAGPRQPLTPQTQMFIGSTSKSFTALAIAQLVEAGKLDLNAPLQIYIPWFRVADEENSAKITIRNLLQHTSGLSESGYSVIPPNDASLEEAVRSLGQARLTAPVGTRHQYFNLGYTVLGYLIELISGETYADYVQAHILSPLGMNSSTARPDDAFDVAQGYTRLFGFNVPMAQPVPQYAIPAGYMVSTAEDMARYALAMKNGGAGLVSPDMMHQIFTPGLDFYGFGWFVYDNGELIMHGGANETFHTDVNLYPRADRAFVMLVNQGHQFDHFISAKQLRDGIEDVVLVRATEPISEGWSVRWMGWSVGLLTLILIFFQVRGLLRLRNWRERTQNLSKGKIAWDIALSFLIPTAIMVFVLTQVKAFYGYRFNLLPTLFMMRLVLPDVFLLMLSGVLPDYIQGVFKLVSLLRKNNMDESVFSANVVRNTG